MEAETYKDIADCIDTETYEFDFGKYSGFNYKFVLNQDPFYIKWLTENVEDFLLDDTAANELIDALANRSVLGRQ